MTAVGQPKTRLDGRLKVTGQAKYSDDFFEPKMLHAVIFGSTIPSGEIKSMDLRAARAVPGVVNIITHENAPSLGKIPKSMSIGIGENFMPLQTKQIFYNGQHIGAVLAETLESAQEAARLVKVSYLTKPAKLDFETSLDEGHDPLTFNGEKLSKKRGVGAQALAAADVTVKSRYTIPTENHNPMEPAATLAWLQGSKLLVYDSTQGVSSTSQHFAAAMKLKPENVTTITKFLGGGFGCKGSFWPHKAICVMASKLTKRPVRLALTREQMFTGMGRRARTIQEIELGARRTGELTAIHHVTYNDTSVNKDFPEPCESATPMLYQCANVETKHIVVPLNYITPTFMRAPGHATGSFSLESAMDELAEKLKIDPIELRLKNYAETDQDRGREFTSKSLRQCYEQGAAKFGWSQRKSTPRSRRDGDWWVGYGFATATYPAQRFNAGASVVLKPDGSADVKSSTQDIGTGTYTVMAQIAADGLTLPLEKVRFDLGDSRFPESGVSGGSTTASSVGTAVKFACEDALKKLKELAAKDKRSALYGEKELQIRDGALWSPKGSETFASLIARNGEIQGEGSLSMAEVMKAKMTGKSGHAFGAQFAEVRVHARTGEVRLSRMCGAFACGKILNPLTARSQFEGGIIYGVGMALMEDTKEDIRNGRLAVKDLADYHMPVQMDIPEIDVVMVDEKDTEINPIGTKGIGEIGITGVAAAIANAVYNATGVRVRDLPLTPDKIIRELHQQA